VARAFRADLAEGLDIVEAEVESGHVEDRVEEHGTVSRRQDEAVAVDPGGVGGVVLHFGAVEVGGQLRGSHGEAGMAGIGFLDGIDGQAPDRKGDLLEGS
jgi:hypothetical protein